MDQFLHVRMTSSNHNFVLPKRINTRNDNMEMGLLECTFQKDSIQNVTNDDKVIVAKYKELFRKEVQFKKGGSIQETLNDMLKKYNSKTYVEYENDRYTIYIDPNHSIFIYWRLATLLGLPQHLYGTTTGTPIKEITVKEDRTDTFRFFSVRPKKVIYSLKPGYYESVQAIRDAFKRQHGLIIREDGQYIGGPLDKAYVKGNMKKLIMASQPINFVLVQSDIVMRENVGDKSFPILRMIARDSKVNRFRDVHYKSIRIHGDIDSIPLRLCDDRGRDLKFSGSVNLSLHIRDAPFKHSML